MGWYVALVLAVVVVVQNGAKIAAFVRWARNGGKA